MADDLMRQIVTLLKRVETQEFDHLAHVIDPGGGVPLLPINDRHLVAADDFSHVNLPEVEVEAAFADFLTQGSWGGWVAFLLCSVGSPRATNPT